MSSNTSNNKNTKNMEEIQTAMQALIAQGRKEGMLRASELNAQLEKLDLSPEKIEEIYDRLDAMNIQVVSSDLDLEVDSDLDGLDLMDGLGDEVDLSGIPEDFSGSLLEVPVGTGILTMPLYKTLPNARVTCLDYSPDMMAQAREKASHLSLSNVTFGQGDVGALPFADESFDIVLSLNGFHAFPAPS